MIYVTEIWLFVQTSKSDNSNTKASLQLNVYVPYTVYGAQLPTVDQQSSTNSINTLGASAQFRWTQGADWPMGAIVADDITEFGLEIVGTDSDNMWRPASIWVVFLTDAGQYVLGPQCPDWNGNQCFSTQSSDCPDARSEWTLPWSQSDQIIEFTSGVINESQLEPSDSALYTFDVVNRTATMTFNNVTILLVYDVDQYEQDGITMGGGLPIGLSGYPEIIVQSLSPGERIPRSFTINTVDATPQVYEFQLVLQSLEIEGMTGKPVFIDDGQSFSVVPD